jgi:hypothetical protein
MRRMVKEYMTQYYQPAMINGIEERNGKERKK